VLRSTVIAEDEAEDAVDTSVTVSLKSHVFGSVATQYRGFRSVLRRARTRFDGRARITPTLNTRKL